MRPQILTLRPLCLTHRLIVRTNRGCLLTPLLLLRQPSVALALAARVVYAVVFSALILAAVKADRAAKKTE